ncbi:unnamed protein product [Tilletia caries]|nr:unnamed protein product [Tilletia caries]
MRPFPSFSLGIVLLGFATIASVLASAITPSDDGSSLLARAVGGKYVGSRCQQNSDCYSDRCVPTDDSTSTYKTCRRQVANGGCFKNDNFLSRNCTAGQCGSSSGGLSGTSTGRHCMDDTLEVKWIVLIRYPHGLSGFHGAAAGGRESSPRLSSPSSPPNVSVGSCDGGIDMLPFNPIEVEDAPHPD